MNRRDFLKYATATSAAFHSILHSFSAEASQNVGSRGPFLLDYSRLRTYVNQFNSQDGEIYDHSIPNKEALAFLKGNIPLFECPDKNIERTYYFRWWTYRKHIKKTPDGFVITEFQPEVPWSGKYNTIACAAGHHIHEGRWLHDQRIMDDYIHFWCSGKGEQYSYSTWLANSVYTRYLVTSDCSFTTSLLNELAENFNGWEKRRLGSNGLFWQNAGADGMEHGIGGDGYRPTINSYMFGEAQAITLIAEMAGNEKLAREYERRTKKLRKLIHEQLWDPEAKFFKVIPRDEDSLVDVRELIGYCPWYFNLPYQGKGYEQAWPALMDPNAFYAPYGLTTAEQSHPEFDIPYDDTGCAWGGPSWPYSTSFTLTALANLLNNYDQNVMTRRDYFRQLVIYARSHQQQLEDGRIVPIIEEEFNPYTGDSVIRTVQKEGIAYQSFDKMKGKDYNHSTFCDLIITGLVGLPPRRDNVVEVNPLLPEGTWRYFCLDNISYHGHILTILWDTTGEHYSRGKGLRVYADGKEIGVSSRLAKITARLPKDPS